MSVRLEGQGRLADGTTRFEFGLVNQGFAWAFPVAGGVNIGVGSFIGKQDADPEAVLARLLPDLGFPPMQESVSAVSYGFGMAITAWMVTASSSSVMPHHCAIPSWRKACARPC